MSTTAAAVNQVTLVGNLTADPVIKQIDEDRRVCQLRLAVNDQKDQPPLFIDIATYGPQADRVRQIPRQRSGDCGHRPPGLPRVGGRGRLPALPAPRRRSRPSPNHRPGGLDHLRTIERQPSLQLSGAPIHRGMGHNQLVPINAGPVPDRLAIWPIDDGRYGLDATFQGASGYARAEHHEAELSRQGVPYSLKQELDGGWTLRFGPLRAIDVAKALGAFVY